MTQLIHTLGHSVELRSGPGRELPLWRYVYGDGKPKPYFHPLCAPKSGIPLTNFEPYDHTWHRGLWFTIKYVNGVNFWEESEPFGTQNSGEPPQVSARDGAEVITLASSSLWKAAPDPAGASLLEERVISFQAWDEDAYVLDWRSEVTAPAGSDVILDRTPFTTWGGYGGLALRGARHWRDTRFVLPDGGTDKLRRGQPSPWCELYGQLDGGRGLSAGVAFFDHPDNPRHPTPFYGHAGDDQKGGPFMNAAFLFHEPLTLPAGEFLNLRYRVLVHDGPRSGEQIQNVYNAYVKETSRS